MPYRAKRREGITFLFATDEVDPDLLHIFARHMMSPEQAIDAWFNYDEEHWNEQFSRFESWWWQPNGWAIAVYWFWRKKDDVVVVISCFYEKPAK